LNFSSAASAPVQTFVVLANNDCHTYQKNNDRHEATTLELEETQSPWRKEDVYLYHLDFDQDGLPSLLF
jgi:hypothetical protein